MKNYNKIVTALHLFVLIFLAILYISEEISDFQVIIGALITFISANIELIWQRVDNHE